MRWYESLALGVLLALVVVAVSGCEEQPNYPPLDAEACWLARDDGSCHWADRHERRFPCDSAGTRPLCFTLKHDATLRQLEPHE